MHLHYSDDVTGKTNAARRTRTDLLYPLWAQPLLTHFKVLVHRRGETRRDEAIILNCMAKFQFPPSASSVDMVWIGETRIEIFVGTILKRIAAYTERLLARQRKHNRARHRETARDIAGPREKSRRTLCSHGQVHLFISI